MQKGINGVRYWCCILILLSSASIYVAFQVSLIHNASLSKSHSHTSPRRLTKRQHRGVGGVQSRNHLHAGTAGIACIRHTPTQGTPYSRLHPNQAQKETRSTRSAEGPHFPLPCDPSQNETCLYTYFPIIVCAFQAAILCGHILEGKRTSIQATPTAVAVYQGASRRKLPIHSNESWVLTIVPGVVCFLARCGCIRKEEVEALAAGQEGKRDLEGFPLRGRHVDAAQ